MATRKRPNPAVAQSERDAANAEDMYELSARDAAPEKGESTANNLMNIASRKRATAMKIKKEKPYLIEEE